MDRRLEERIHDDIQAALEHEPGTRRNGRRIAKLWMRRGNTDCTTEVGMPDPLRGGIVPVVFDVRRRRPLVVWWRSHGAAPTDARAILSQHADSVVESDP